MLNYAARTDAGKYGFVNDASRVLWKISLCVYECELSVYVEIEFTITKY